MLHTHNYHPQTAAPGRVNPRGGSSLGVTAVERAKERIHPYIRRTPCLHAPALGGWLKLENLQHTGAYKVRGACNALAASLERGDRRDVIAASAGNHASGVAFAARALGLKAWTVMPRSAPRSKIAMTAKHGGEVVLAGETYEEAHTHARSLAKSRGLRLVPAFDDADIIAGQGTVGLELRKQAADVVFVPIGGGGLAAGVGLALKESATRVVGVQLQQLNGMVRALKDQAPMAHLPSTLADGVQVRSPGHLTTEVCREVLDDLVLVSEQELRETMVSLMENERIVAEGAGALAVTAMRRYPGRRKVAVLSGGNIDLPLLNRVMTEERSGDARLSPSSPHSASLPAWS